MREILLVAGDAAGVLVGEDVLVAREDLVAVPAAEVVAVPVLAQRLRVLAREDELVAGAAPRLQVLCVVPLAVDFVVEYAVREINLKVENVGNRHNTTRATPALFNRPVAHHKWCKRSSLGATSWRCRISAR